MLECRHREGWESACPAPPLNRGSPVLSRCSWKGWPSCSSPPDMLVPVRAGIFLGIVSENSSFLLHSQETNKTLTTKHHPLTSHFFFFFHLLELLSSAPYRSSGKGSATRLGVLTAVRTKVGVAVAVCTKGVWCFLALCQNYNLHQQELGWLPVVL